MKKLLLITLLFMATFAKSQVPGIGFSTVTPANWKYNNTTKQIVPYLGGNVWLWLVSQSQEKAKIDSIKHVNDNLFSLKQNTITTGTTSQYFRGDLSLATFPTIPDSTKFILVKTVSSVTPQTAYIHITGFGKFGSYIEGTQFLSTVSNGTSPLLINSTTKVANLNSDLLDGQEGSYYADYTNLSNKPTIPTQYTDAMARSAQYTASSSVTGLLTSTDWSTFNGKQASGSYVTTSTTVNGHALSGNVTVTPTDLSLVIGTNILAYRTFGSAANSATTDFEVPLTFSTGLTRTGNTITNNITQYTDALARAAQYTANTTTTGLLTSTDWNTFNNKVSASGYLPLSAGSGNALTGTLYGTAATFSSSVSATQFNPTNLTANHLPKMGTGGLVNSLISDDGTNVGIGTTAPVAALHISGAVSAPSLTSQTGLFRLSGTGDVGLNIGDLNTNHSIWMQVTNEPSTGGTAYSLLLNPLGGNVGIGYSTGTEITNNKFAVNGNGYFGGSVTATGATFTTGAGSGKVWTSDGSGVGSWHTNSVPTLSSGTYTPTITNLYGTSSITARESTYQQIGNIIHVKVTGQFVQTQINPSLSISLPFTRGSAQVNYPVGVGIVDVSGITTTAHVMGETTTSIWLYYTGANISSNCDFAVEFDYSL